MTNGRVLNLEFAWIARLNSAGNTTGQLDPDNLGSDVVSPAYVIKGGMKLTTAKGTRRTAEWSSYGAPDGKRQGGLDTIGTATLEVNRWDNTLSTIINNGLIDTTTLVGAEISAPNNMNPLPNQLVFCGIASIDIPSGGTEYLHFFYPNCTMSEADGDVNQLEGQQKNPNSKILTIEPGIGSSFPVGVAFSTAQGWYGDQEFEFRLASAYPYFLDAYIADGTQTDFDLTVKPKYSDVTSGKTKNWTTKNAALTATTSISTTTGNVVIASAGSDGDIWNAMYMVDPTVLKTLAA